MTWRAKACIDFIISDLDKSADLLAPFTTNCTLDGEYGRVTAGSALALKGRVLTLWCSPLFNRHKDMSRFKQAYDVMSADLDKIKSYGYHLYDAGGPGANASAFANMFATSAINPEMLFGTLYNTLVDFSGFADDVKHNRWERSIRPSNTGGTDLQATQEMVDLFPMRDGKVCPGYNAYSKLNKSTTFSYDKRYPFMDRDPRFYRTFTFPGFRWAYTTGSNGDATAMNPNNPSYNKGKDYTLWNYVW